MNRFQVGAIAVFGIVSGAATRAPESVATSDALRPLLDCRGIAIDADRLRCYDRAAATVSDAAAKHDIVIVDRNAIRKVRRSLFGFGTPALGPLDDQRTDEPAPSEITSTVRSARRDGDGTWIVTLEDDAIWHQTGGQMAGALRPGETVVIKRAALGSYFLRVGNRPGVKARREG